VNDFELANNGISVPIRTARILYNELFNNKELNISDTNKFSYEQYQLDNFKKYFNILKEFMGTELLNLILELNLIYDEISSILQEHYVIITYSNDDTPLLKRVIFAQVLKFDENLQYNEQKLDFYAKKINEITMNLCFKIPIKLLPWDDLE